MVLSLHIVSPVPWIHELSASANTRHADGAHRIQILKNRAIDRGWLLDPQGQFGFTVVHLVWEDLKSSQSQLARLKRAPLKPTGAQIVVAEPWWVLASLSRKVFKSVSMAVFVAVPCGLLMVLEGCAVTHAPSGGALRNWSLPRLIICLMYT